MSMMHVPIANSCVGLLLALGILNAVVALPVPYSLAGHDRLLVD
jgi:hypothetical protein